MSTSPQSLRKLRIATCSLAGCFGCHMSFLDIDEALAAKYPYDPAYLPVARLEDGTLWDW